MRATTNSPQTTQGPACPVRDDRGRARRAILAGSPCDLPDDTARYHARPGLRERAATSIPTTTSLFFLDANPECGESPRQHRTVVRRSRCASPLAIAALVTGFGLSPALAQVPVIDDANLQKAQQIASDTSKILTADQQIMQFTQKTLQAVTGDRSSQAQGSLAQMALGGGFTMAQAPSLGSVIIRWSIVLCRAWALDRRTSSRH